MEEFNYSDIDWEHSTAQSARTGRFINMLTDNFISQHSLIRETIWEEMFVPKNSEQWECFKDVLNGH